MAANPVDVETGMPAAAAGMNGGEHGLRSRIRQLEEELATHRGRGGKGHDEREAYGSPGNTAPFPTGVYGPYIRPLANPAPLGLLGFGLTTALLQGANTRWTDGSTNYLVYCYAIFFGGLAQFIAGMWEIARNNMFGAVAFSGYGSFWLGYGLYGILASTGIFGEGSSVEGLQMFLALWCIFTACLWVQTFNINIALNMLFMFLTITFALLAAGTNHPRVNKAGGYFGVATAFLAWFIAFAELTNEVWGRKVIPLGLLNPATREFSKRERRPNTL